MCRRRRGPPGRTQALLPGTDCPAPRNPPDHHVVHRHDQCRAGAPTGRRPKSTRLRNRLQGAAPAMPALPICSRLAPIYGVPPYPAGQRGHGHVTATVEAVQADGTRSAPHESHGRVDEEGEHSLACLGRVGERRRAARAYPRPEGRDPERASSGVCLCSTPSGVVGAPRRAAARDGHVPNREDAAASGGWRGRSREMRPCGEVPDIR